MSKLVSIVFFLTLLTFPVVSQKIQNELPAKIWYCACDFNADSLVISVDNTSRPTSEMKFSSTGKLIIKNIKKRSIDSSFFYHFSKKSLVLKSILKDSIRILRYTGKKVQGKNAYLLSLKDYTRYKKHKGDDTVLVGKITLVSGKKRKTIKRNDEVSVFSQKRALRNDSIDRAVLGVFAGYIADTLLIDCDQLVEHNFYKKHTDTLHYYVPRLKDTAVRIKIPVKDITGIYGPREPFSKRATKVTLLGAFVGIASVTGFFIVGEKNVAASTLAQTAIVSFLTIPVSFGLNLIFSKQKFKMKLSPGEKNKKIWTLDRRLPGMVTKHVKKRKKKKPSN